MVASCCIDCGEATSPAVLAGHDATAPLLQAPLWGRRLTASAGGTRAAMLPHGGGRLGRAAQAPPRLLARREAGRERPEAPSSSRQPLPHSLPRRRRSSQRCDPSWGSNRPVILTALGVAAPAGAAMPGPGGCRGRRLGCRAGSRCAMWDAGAAGIGGSSGALRGASALSACASGTHHCGTGGKRFR